MKKTAEMAGMPTWIAATGHPEPMAILFMD